MVIRCEFVWGGFERLVLVLIGVWVLRVCCFGFSCCLGGDLLFRGACLLVLCFAVYCGMTLVRLRVCEF